MIYIVPFSRLVCSLNDKSLELEELTLKKVPEETFIPQPQDAQVAVESIKVALEAIAGKWKLSILATLACGTCRYGQLKRAIPSVTEKVLIQQLKQLEAAKLIERTVYSTVPPQVEYALTEHGRSLQNILNEFRIWGDIHRQYIQQ